jgi:peptidoglycan/LPS O-acetylase OafA/YrhL
MTNLNFCKTNELINKLCIENIMNNTKDSTNTLRGIAILIILINHYLNLNVSITNIGFANLWVAIFFILSGYGIQHSLGKTFNNGKQQSALQYFRFYYSRIIRIFPLFLMAYLSECLIFKTPLFLFTVLGIRADTHLWFIPAIIQCYILAPFIHVLINKHRILMLVIIISTFVFFNVYFSSNYAPELLIIVLKKMHMYWRHIFFLYLVIFSLSMFIPKIESGWHKITNHEKILYYCLLVGVVIFSMLFVQYNTILPGMYAFTVKTTYPLLLIIFLSIYLIFNKIKIPVISFVGENAYPIYLFHMIFYLTVNKYSAYGKDSVFEFCLIILLFTPFVYFCKYIEIYSNLLVKLIEATILKKLM